MHIVRAGAYLKTRAAFFMMTETEVKDAPSEAKRARLDDDCAGSTDKLSEVEVGITEFVLPKQSGFKGTLKGRLEHLVLCHFQQVGRFPRS